jgi:hypothetical protein
MDPMPTQPAHAKPRAEGLIAAWLCLVIAGAATVTFNIVHAWRSGMGSPLGVVEGVVPVALAMIVSHLVATSSAGKLLRGITFAVMIGALALSVRATGAVVAPAAGPLWWLYGAVVDTAALVSLQVLLTLKSRAAERARERAAQEAAEASELVSLRAELVTALADVEPLRDALAAAQADAGQANERAESLAAKLKAATARKQRPATARKSASVTARKSEPVTGSATAPVTDVVTAPDEAPADLDSEAKVLWYLDKGYSASKAGTLSGLTDSRGRQIARLAATAPKGPDAKE